MAPETKRYKIELTQQAAQISFGFLKKILTFDNNWKINFNFFPGFREAVAALIEVMKYITNLSSTVP